MSSSEEWKEKAPKMLALGAAGLLAAYLVYRSVSGGSQEEEAPAEAAKETPQVQEPDGGPDVVVKPDGAGATDEPEAPGAAVQALAADLMDRVATSVHELEAQKAAEEAAAQEAAAAAQRAKMAQVMGQKVADTQALREQAKALALAAQKAQEEAEAAKKAQEEAAAAQRAKVGAGVAGQLQDASDALAKEQAQKAAEAAAKAKAEAAAKAKAEAEAAAQAAAAAEAAAKAKAAAEKAAKLAASPKGVLTLTVKNAKITIKTSVFDKMDPYVIFTIPDPADAKKKLWTAKTKVADDQGQTPVWNEKFTIEVADKNAPIKFEMWDENVVSDDSIGYGQFTAAQYGLVNGPNFQKTFDKNDKPTAQLFMDGVWEPRL